MLETTELSTIMSVSAEVSMLGWRREGVSSLLTAIMSLFYNETQLGMSSCFNNGMYSVIYAFTF